MTKKTFSIGAAILLALLASAWAADISGKWLADAPGNQGNVEITLILKAEGTTLTGTLENPQAPGAIDIKDGKIEGDAISFYVSRKFGENEMKVMWKGTVTGDEIQFVRETAGGAGGPGGGGAPTKIIAKRAK